MIDVGILMRAKLLFFFVLYWLANVANVVYKSRSPGCYPAHLRNQATEFSFQRPLPFTDIVLTATSILAVIIAFYLIAIKTKHATVISFVISLILLITQSVLVPTDVAGVQYAITQFLAFSICISLVAFLFSHFGRIKQRIKKRLF